MLLQPLQRTYPLNAGHLQVNTEDVITTSQVLAGEDLLNEAEFEEDAGLRAYRDCLYGRVPKKTYDMYISTFTDPPEQELEPGGLVDLTRRALLAALGTFKGGNDPGRGSESTCFAVSSSGSSDESPAEPCRTDAESHGDVSYEGGWSTGPSGRALLSRAREGLVRSGAPKGTSNATHFTPLGPEGTDSTHNSSRSAGNNWAALVERSRRILEADTSTEAGEFLNVLQQLQQAARSDLEEVEAELGQMNGQIHRVLQGGGLEGNSVAKAALSGADAMGLSSGDYSVFGGYLLTHGSVYSQYNMPGRAVSIMFNNGLCCECMVFRRRSLISLRS